MFLLAIGETSITALFQIDVKSALANIAADTSHIMKVSYLK